jgi:hypothetical protein
VSAKKNSTRRTMSDEHKQAIADARRQNQAVRDYLTALTAPRPAGRQPSTSPEQLQEQIDTESDPVARLELIQRRLDLEERLAAEHDQPDLDRLQAAFVAVGADYAARKGITTPPSENPASRRRFSNSRKPALRAPAARADHTHVPAPGPRCHRPTRPAVPALWCDTRSHELSAYIDWRSTMSKM